MKNTNRCTIICGILSLVLLVANFLPFWFYDGTSASIHGYIWLPEHYDALEKFISEQMGTQFMLNMPQIGAPILILAASAVSACFCCLKSKSRVSSVVCVICGAICFVFYASSALLREGSLWWLHMLLSAAMIVVGLIANGQTIQQWIHNKKQHAE